VADVRPFRALTYDEEVAGPLAELVSPPYDVITAEQRDGYLASSPFNAVRLILPEVGYEQVADLIAAWRELGAIRRSDRPIMVAWTQTFTPAGGERSERRTILATVALEPYERRVVRPHERTLAGPKEDRLRLTRAVRANLSPVFGLYPDPDGRVWAAAAVSGDPLATVTDAEGTEHRFWVVDEPAACAAVGAAMADRWILIADGHHRYETALAYREERRRNGGGPEAPSERVMMGLTALEDPGLVVLPTHRLLHEWREDAVAGFTPTPAADLDELLAMLAASDPARPAFGLVRPDGAALLLGEHAVGASPGRRLDAAVLEREVLLGAFGEDQAALTARGALGYSKDPAECWATVRSGGAQAAFILRPIAKTAVAEVSEAGETMPQKSTYFFPKLLTGVAFNPLDDG
jgi:uncharacterized protein (DUF1015 family)